jgi:hypothetical protein
MSHLHLCCLGLVDEGGQPGGVEYFPDADSGPADNEIAAAIFARAAVIFQRGRRLQLVRSIGPSFPSVPWARGCMFTMLATPHKGNGAAHSRIAALGFPGCNHPWQRRDRGRRVPRLLAKGRPK